MVMSAWIPERGFNFGEYGQVEKQLRIVAE